MEQDLSELTQLIIEGKSVHIGVYYYLKQVLTELKEYDFYDEETQKLTNVSEDDFFWNACIALEELSVEMNDKNFVVDEDTNYNAMRIKPLRNNN